MFRPACIWNHIGFRGWLSRAADRTSWILILAPLAYFTWTPVAGALPEPAAHAAVPTGLRQGQNAQYHGRQGPQYHRVAPRFGRISARPRASSRPDRELTKPISARVISPIFTFHSPKSTKKAQKVTSFRSDDRIGDRNDRSIGAQIGSGNEPQSRDPRLMLQIGAVFGLIYVAFLVLWFWATRFRVRPPRSAPS